MTVKPILFSGPMVRAILREIEAPGTGKTQTRLVIKPQPFIDANGNFCCADRSGKLWNWGQHLDGRPCIRNFIEEKCFAVGDLLWVREGSADVHPIAVQEGRYSIIGQAGIPGPPLVKYRRVYRADGDVLQVWHSSKGYPFRSLEQEDELAGRNPIVCSEWVGRLKYQPWTPSIHMPRWASRLTLEVTGVKVERLQDISEADARAEGVESDTDGWRDYLMPATQCCACARDSYRTLWDAINGPGAWDANPWVAAITFRPYLCNIDAFMKERTP